MKIAIYGRPISEDTSEGPDVLAVTGCVAIVDDELPIPDPLESHWVGGYVRGCANMTPEERQNVIDQLTEQAVTQVAELLR